MKAPEEGTGGREGAREREGFIVGISRCDATRRDAILLS
jgi:hypothetical protein